MSKEVIDGYTCPQTKQETDAHRRLTFEQLPPILILHLKCFVYDKHGGSQKVLHNMDFSTTLEFEKGRQDRKKPPSVTKIWQAPIMCTGVRDTPHQLYDFKIYQG